MKYSEQDRRFMQRALQLARRGEGRVEPNPMVGCVLVKGGRMIAEGCHRHFGGPHAEVMALRRLADSAFGATAYVTLEPCSHFGKTPPCCDALIEAKVTRVVASMRDPSPQVSGRGFARLRKAGIQVDVGMLQDEAAELMAPFLTRLALQRPFVIAKWAQSLDGRIATRTGASQWISGVQARRFVHRLRARVDAIMVGISTVLADDPMLTARDVPLRRRALRAVMDTQLRTPPRCRLVQTAQEVPTIVFTSRKALKEAPNRAVELRARAVNVVACRLTSGHVSVSDAVDRLARDGCTNLLVEGGGELLGSFFDQSLVDVAHIITAPLIIGGRKAVASCGGSGASDVSLAVRPRFLTRRMLGGDTLITARVTSPPQVGGNPASTVSTAQK